MEQMNYHVRNFLLDGNYDVVRKFVEEKRWIVENCGFYVEHSMEQYNKITKHV
jgi:hypothetical protein